jgi:hypothetical protein
LLAVEWINSTFYNQLIFQSMFFLRIPILCLFFLLEINFINAQNVGIGTATPAQKLEVAGVVRLAPEAHNGTTLSRLITVDENGDIGANPETGFPVLDAVAYDLSGQVIKSNASCQVDLPGPIINHTLVSSFKFFTPCNLSAAAIVVNFKRYGASGNYAFTYSLGNVTSTTITNTNTINIPWNVGCGARTLTITLNTGTNELTFSVAGAGTVGLYLHSGRTALLRWI